MTKVITRYFESAADARAAKSELILRRRLSPRIVDLYTSPKGLADTLKAARVNAETASAYADRLAKGGAVLMVRAGYKPLGVAQITRDVADEMGGPEIAGLTEEVYVKDDIRPTLTILEDHPLLLTRPRDPDSTTFHMADWPIPLISRRKPSDHMVIERHGHMAGFAVPLLYKDWMGEEYKPYTKSIFPRHARMADWPIGLLSRRKPYTGSVIAPHAHMANFPIPLISRRKPYTGSIFPRHQRMATVPFPLLINGKTGTNALIPGAPHMANFPIRLISHRKPYTGSIFRRHARMASFPIPLISRRKPITASIFPRHAHMANFPWPLVIRRSDTAKPDGGSGWSFSKAIGMKTISRR